VKNDLIHGFVQVAVSVARRLPHGVLRSLCRALAMLAYLVLGRERRRVRVRLEQGLGRSPSAAGVCRAFSQAGQMLADTLALLKPAERACRTLALDCESRTVFQRALAEGRGVVFISAHLGSWERLAALLVEEGFPVATVARESYDPRFTALYERLRRPRGVRSIYRGNAGAVRSILRELSAGGAVGFLVDIPGRVPCAPARLFGARCWLPLGPARIAIASGAAVLVGTCGPPSPSSSNPEPGCVTITRISMPSLSGQGASQDRLVSALIARIAEELDRRIAAWPHAWLGLFAPPRLQQGADRL
jgi:KDO2-lipid IV(A) lauroyltransferase